MRDETLIFKVKLRTKTLVEKYGCNAGKSVLFLMALTFYKKKLIRLDSATYVHLDFPYFCLKILTATEIISKISKAFSPLFIVNFLYGIFILFSSKSK